jgi:HD-like signal output (HDOD) protein
MKLHIDHLITGFRATASPPIMYLKLNEAINDPSSSLTKVSEVISEDSSLSARLLKLVNSSFYGFPQRIGTISDAVFLVGSNQVRDLALATTMMNTFKGIPEELISMEKFWKHSLACGIGSKIIAETAGSTDIERFFVSGVLHDIGRLVLFTKAPVESRTILEKSQTELLPLYTIETNEIGFSHCEIGRALADSWRLPQIFQEVIGYHHLPEKAQQYPFETAVVHLADIIAHALQIGNSGEHFVPPLEKKSWERLNLSTHHIEIIMNSVMNEIETLNHLLEPE